MNSLRKDGEDYRPFYKTKFSIIFRTLVLITALALLTLSSQAKLKGYFPPGVNFSSVIIVTSLFINTLGHITAYIIKYRRFNKFILLELGIGAILMGIGWFTFFQS